MDDGHEEKMKKGINKWRNIWLKKGINKWRNIWLKKGMKGMKMNENEGKD